MLVPHAWCACFRIRTHTHTVICIHSYTSMYIYTNLYMYINNIYIHILWCQCKYVPPMRMSTGGVLSVHMWVVLIQSCIICMYFWWYVRNYLWCCRPAHMLTRGLRGIQQYVVFACQHPMYACKYNIIGETRIYIHTHMWSVTPTLSLTIAYHWGWHLKIITDAELLETPQN